MNSDLLKIGQVIEVRGQRIKIRVFQNKNAALLFCNGDIIKNVCVGNLIKISKGYSSIICKVEGEYIQELCKEENSSKRFQKISDSIERIVEVNVIGIIQNNSFQKGIIEIPLIFSDVFLLTKEELNHIFKFFTSIDKAISIGDVLAYEDYKLFVDIQNLFASHIGIFGNTGSGKSNTLAKIYTELFRKSNEFANFNKSNFLFIDFNGEYTNAFSCVENRKVYKLSTRTDSGDKIPFAKSIFSDLEFWSIICEATEKTQTPFLKRCIRLYTYLINNYNKGSILAEIQNLLEHYFETPALVKEKQHVFFDALNLILNDISRIQSLFNSIDVFKESTLRINKSIYLNSKDDFDQQFIQPILAEITDENIKNIDECILFPFSMYFNYLKELSCNYIIDEHIAPLIKRFDSRSNDLLKLFDFKDNYNHSQVEIVSLLDVGLVFKKIVPMLLCKNKYEEQKKTITNNNSSLHIIIDEAHNILSPTSERESQTWKDYRLETFEEIIKEGRKFGVFMTISSQRPSDISATIVSQLHNYFIHRLVNNEDIRMIAKAVAFIDSASFDMIPVLPQGGCIFTGVASNFPVIIKVKLLEEENRPQSSTINLCEIWNL